VADQRDTDREFTLIYLATFDCLAIMDLSRRRFSSAGSEIWDPFRYMTFHVRWAGTRFEGQGLFRLPGLALA
jgi:hypothetical protein